MKKSFVFLTIIILFVFTVGCQKSSSNATTFVTSCYPVHIITLNLVDGVDGVQVTNMSQSHRGCLHNFQMQSDDLKNIEKSSAFIINGAGMENFLDKVVHEIPNVKIIDSSIGINLMDDCSEHSHCHEHDNCDEDDHDHCCHSYNPHIWTSVDNYISQVKNVTRGLAVVDPDHKGMYQKNCDTYVQKLTSLKKEMVENLSDFGGKEIVTFHEAFPYFAKEFGFHIAAVITSEPENEPGAKQISDVISTIKEKNIGCIFVEPQYTCKAAQVISQETGAKIYTLDPIVTGSDDKNSYIDAMKHNLETLKKALT